jgi:DNA-binding NtrC family response regulator/pSer/pThr/pTyr-binding forkhead associated (FHA) protein
MATEIQTQDAGTAFGAAPSGTAFLVIHVEGEERGSRVVDLPDGVDVTFGRSRGATVHVESEKVSRMHARVRRTGDTIEVEDLGSRNGTRVNGDKLEAVTRVTPGDEIAIGPILAVVGTTSGLRRASPVADDVRGESRLVAEVDRAMRYHRPLAIALVHIANDGVIDAMARSLRPMDLMAEDAGDDYLVILPELTPPEADEAIERLLDFARAAGVTTKHALAHYPQNGRTVEALISSVRGTLRRGGAPRTSTSPSANAPIVLDAAMRRVYQLVDRVAPTDTSVLILGETGVGIETVANAIRTRSPRAARPLITLGCSALSESQLETELTTAVEAANHGTLLLDDVSDLPLAIQAKLLRALQPRASSRAGTSSDVHPPLDVRIIASSHRDLDAEVRAGRVRQDLASRLAGFTIAVPPLRDRQSEIIPLAEQFAQLAAAEAGRPAPALAHDARDALSSYSWPGNVRELENAIERALVLCGEQLTAADLPEKLRNAGHHVRPVAQSPDVRGHLADVERAAIVAALEAEDQNQTRAARRLGLSRRALIYKMEKYGLKPPPARGEG